MRNLILIIAIFILGACAQIQEGLALSTEKYYPVGDDFFHESEKHLVISYRKYKGIERPHISHRVGKINRHTYLYRSTENKYIGVVAKDTKKTHSQISHLSGDWHITCKKDRGDDKKVCRISLMMKIWKNHYEALSIGYFQPSEPRVICVGSDHYPQTSMQIRVDKNQMHDASEKTCFHKSVSSLISEMETGNLIMTRFKKWPYKNWIEMEFKPEGLREAIQLAQWLFGKL